MRPVVAALAAMVIVGGALVLAGPAAGGGGGGCHQQTSGTGDSVTMEEGCFTPSVLEVEPGTTVTWTNDDPHDHVVVGTGWGTGDLVGHGDETSHRFEEPGAYPYTCNLHPGMNGVVLVGDVSTAAAGVLPDGDDGTSAGSLAAAALAGAAVGALAVTAGRRLRSRL